jgi:hypothetical protein
VQAGEEISGGLLIAGGDGSKMLDDAEEPFDEISLAVERKVAIALDFPV